MYIYYLEMLTKIGKLVTIQVTSVNNAVIKSNTALYNKNSIWTRKVIPKNIGATKEVETKQLIPRDNKKL